MRNATDVWPDPGDQALLEWSGREPNAVAPLVEPDRDRGFAPFSVILNHHAEAPVPPRQRRAAETGSLHDPDWWADAWGDARMETAREKGIGFDRLPADCPWEIHQVLDAAFWPDGC